MKLWIQDTFPCTPEQYWESFFDPGLDAELAAASAAQMETLSEENRDGVIVKHQRFIFPTKAPTALARMTGIDDLEFEQISEIDRAHSVVRFRVIPPKLQDRIRAGGEYRVSAHPDGCERTVDGHVSVNIPLVGRRVEELVVQSLKRTYTQGTIIRTEWLKRQDW